MLPRLENGQQAFIEITNTTHGGIGWELGRRLWSPVYANTARPQSRIRAWRIMEDIHAGDLILHLVNQNDIYHFAGISLAASMVQQTNNTPPQPDQWGHMAPYQFVELSNFYKFQQPEPITTLFNSYREDLVRIKRENSDGTFYVLYGPQEELRVSQRYLAPCSRSVYELFSELTENMGVDLAIETSAPISNDTGSNNDDQSAGRVLVSVSRIIRDSALSKRIKTEFQGCCQVCGISLLLPNGNYYSEGHHIKPLGKRHNGPDIRENIIVVCPNHHAEFDFYSIAIHPQTLRLHHINPENPYHNKELAYNRPELRSDLLEYHYRTFLNNFDPS